MNLKEKQLIKLLQLKFQAAEARVVSALETCKDIEKQIAKVHARRNVQPDDPADQIFHERHIGWLDQRGRELSILAAQAIAEHSVAKDALKVEFGRKSAMERAFEKRDLEDKRRRFNQLS